MTKNIRKYEYRRYLPHLQPDCRFIAVTFATRLRWTLPENCRDLVLKHIQHEHHRRATVHAAVVMPDHVHILMTPLRDTSTQSYTLAEILHGIKSASAHSVNKSLERTGRVWEEEYFDHALRANETIDATIDYIRMNPVRAGLVKSPAENRRTW